MWDVLSLGLGIGASAAAVIAALWAVWKLGNRLWDLTLGRRRAQAALLDQVACTVSIVFIESILGVPLLITHPYGTTLREERTYRLPGAWVTVEPKDGAVQLFSITVTDPNMYYDITEMTSGVLNVKLGKDTFAHAGDLHDGEKLWILPGQRGYLRHYQLAKSSRHQHYWLSHNAAGAGAFSSEGTYCAGSYGTRSWETIPPDPAAITANTFTASRVGDDETRSREIFGPHVDNMPVIAAVRGQHSQSLLRRLFSRSA
jgi:hypothetical protein